MHLAVEFCDKNLLACHAAFSCRSVTFGGRPSDPHL